VLTSWGLQNFKNLVESYMSLSNQTDERFYHCSLSVDLGQALQQPEHRGAPLKPLVYFSEIN